jgi:hypothetical protein
MPADGLQDVGIDPRVTFEVTVKVVAEPVDPIEFVEQFEQGARPEAVDALDEALPAKVLSRLRTKGIVS